jgi:hypothetical protein
MKNSFLILFIASLSTISCQKNSGDDNNEETKTQLLIKSPWKFDNAGIDQNKDGTAELPVPASTFSACLLDNTITFASNGIGTVSENTFVCPGAAPVTPITWSLSNNATTLNLSGGGIAGVSGSLKVLELSDTKLSLSKDTVLLGTSLAFIINLKH